MLCVPKNPQLPIEWVKFGLLCNLSASHAQSRIPFLNSALQFDRHGLRVKCKFFRLEMSKCRRNRLKELNPRLSGVRFTVRIGPAELSTSTFVTMPFERSVEASRKGGFVERLGQVASCSGSQRLRASVLIGVGRDENEWHATPLGKQVCLQLDAAHAGHLDICNHARGDIRMGRLQEIFSRREQMDNVPERPQ
jgi:hypothetical protein